MHKLKEKFREILENKKTDWFRGLLRIELWQKRAKEYFPDTALCVTKRYSNSSEQNNF